MNKYISPEFKKDAFHCACCQTYSHQRWGVFLGRYIENDYFSIREKDFPLYFCQCQRCGGLMVWREGSMLIPYESTIPPAHNDMPEVVRCDYDEARSVFASSPKAAAALLRLAAQKLLKELGESGDNINDDIRSLVKKGLPERVQKMLDICRVVGNNAVHPGVIDLNEDKDMVKNIFYFINLIVEYQIALPEKIEKQFENLPENAKSAIEKRDARSV